MSKINQNEIKLGKRIRRLRRQANLTQEKLAEQVGVSTTHIGLVETGKRRASLKTLQKIAKILKVRTGDLLPF